jgi:hypothetical protein
MLDGTYAATVDRIVEGRAMLLIEGDDGPAAERHLPAAELPDDAGEGGVCEVTFEAGDLVDVEYRPEATATRRERLCERFDRLSRRLGDDEEE